MDEQEINIISNSTRKEKFKNFVINNKKILLFLILISILSILILFFILEYKKKDRIKLADKYNYLILNYSASNKDITNSELTKIIFKKDKAYSPLALYFLIDKEIEKDKKIINQYFDFIINDIGLEKDLVNLNIYKKALYNGDSQNENFLIQTLDPLIKENSVWTSHALYFLGEYFYSKGDKIKAKEFFNNIILNSDSNKEIQLEAQKRLQRDLSD